MPPSSYAYFVPFTFGFRGYDDDRPSVTTRRHPRDGGFLRAFARHAPCSKSNHNADITAGGFSMRSHYTMLTFAFTLLAAACGSSSNDGQSGTNGTAGVAGTGGVAGPAGAAGAAGTAGVQGNPGPFKPIRLLDERIDGWKPANRARLNKLLTDRGIASPTFDPAKRPVATFDWDNTIVKNDIGDATFFWMLKHDKIRQPAGKDWGTTSTALSDDAKAALNAACDGLASPGGALPTSSDSDCADAILKIYDGLKTPAGADAWTPSYATTSKINFSYAWVAQLTAGSTPDEVRSYARAAYAENTAAPIGTTQTVGSVTGLNGYVRAYEPIADLIGAFQDNGFDVWVTTASPQFIVDAVSMDVGVPPSHVLGIRSVVTNGVITPDLQGCGTVADGANTMITFDEGKRCWINKVIFKQLAASQAATNPDLAKRQVFAAGDSDTDIAFLKDATDVKLVINRNKGQIMCNALNNYMNRWIIEPMFISPKAPKLTPYDCPNIKDNNGVPGVKDEAGNAIPQKSE
jgi:phosphoserine phosphatase